MLVLFDIDGTLLLTRRAGAAAMHDAAREIFGDSFTMDGIEMAGRIDPLIWRDMAAANGIDDHAAHHDRFRSVYARHLARRIAENNTVTLLPGVAALLDAVEALGGGALGVLTGNYPETGRLKIQAAGVDADRFPIAAWGCDGGSRRDLPAVAMRRHREQLGRAIHPARVVIIGDTPLDVDCAAAAGCRALAVGTGGYAASDLAACGADLAVDDLSDTTRIVSWIFER